VIAVIDPEWARRIEVVDALRAHSLSAFGIASLRDLDDDERKATLMLLRTEDSDDARAGLAHIADSARLRAVPVIVVGGGDGGDEAMQALRAGADDYVSVDVQGNELCARIEARLESRQRVAQLARQHREAAMVLELTQALSSALDLREILGLVVRRVAEVITVDRVSIVLRGADGRGYVVVASDDENLRDLPIRFEDYPEIERVLESGRPLEIEDATGHALFAMPDLAGPGRFRSLMLFPIAFQDRTMGVLFLRNERPTVLTVDDGFLLRALANATGIALRNARLLQSLRDQSARVRDQRARDEQRIRLLERYLDLFNSSADGIVVATLAGEVLFCNPAACRITGRAEDQLRGHQLDDLLFADGRKRLRELQEGFQRSVFPSSIDLPIRTADNDRRVLNVSFNSMLEDHQAVILSFRDVTEERSLARELTKTKEFLQRVIDSSVDAIVSADTRGEVLLFNPAAERTYGFSAEEVIGQLNVAELYPDGVAREHMRLMRSDEYGGVGILQGYETALLGKDGVPIPVLLSAALISHRGRVIGSVGIFRDLRARRHIEERLAATERELEQQQKQALIAELAGATAHELNQPLTAVMGYAEMLGRKLEHDSPLSQASAAILRQTERMAEIVRKIGKLTKYETKTYVGDTRIIDIDRSIDTDPPATGT
jgi:PAS domain S-box-containing protein